MAKASDAQKDTVERVMHEFKHGELEQQGGERVKDPKQAIAIALREAGASNQESPAKNRSSLAKTKRKESRAKTARDEKEGPSGRAASAVTKAALYAEAKRRKLAGRSAMTKAQLERALHA